MKKQYIHPTTITCEAIANHLMAVSDTKGDSYKPSVNPDQPQPGGNGDGSDYAKKNNFNLWEDDEE